MLNYPSKYHPNKFTISCVMPFLMNLQMISISYKVNLHTVISQDCSQILNLKDSDGTC